MNSCNDQSLRNKRLQRKDIVNLSITKLAEEINNEKNKDIKIGKESQLINLKYYEKIITIGYMDNDNTHWYFKIENIDTLYKNVNEKVKQIFTEEDWKKMWINKPLYGVLILNDDFPYKPSSIKILNTNGRYKQQEFICLNGITGFHPETYTPLIDIFTIISSFLTFTIDIELNNKDIPVGTYMYVDKKTLLKKYEEMYNDNFIYNKNDVIFVDDEVIKKFLNKTKDGLIIKNCIN